MNFYQILSVTLLYMICVDGKYHSENSERRIDSRHHQHRQSPPPSTLHTKRKINNRQLFGKLGLSEIRIPPSHSRKRLAVASRRHSHPDDSKVFVVKLPPNPYYYSKPFNSKNTIIPTKDLNKVAFKSNGKLEKIYHWNLPIIKKILNEKVKRPTARHHDNSDLMDIKKIPTWSNPWENETIEKAFGKYRSANQNNRNNNNNNNKNKEASKKSAPTYFAPHDYYQTGNKFHKHFPGNGKPKGFYVMKQNSKTPILYKKLIS